MVIIFWILFLPVLLLGHLLTTINRGLHQLVLWTDHHNGVVTAVGTIAIAAFTWQLWATSSHQWRTMQQQLALSERPWVAASVSLDEPLSFNTQGYGEMRVNVTTRNVGRSVAQHIFTRSKIVAVCAPTDLLKAQETFCSPFRAVTNELGSVLFPDDKRSESIPAEISPDEVRQALAVSPIKGQIMCAALVVCVDYQFSFDTAHHQTRFAFLLGRPNPGRYSWMGAFSPVGQPQGFVLIDSWWGNSAD